MNSSRSKYADNAKVKNVRIVNPGASPDPGGGSAQNAVKYIPQALNEQQKAQARMNIGSPSIKDVADVADSVVEERQRAIGAETNLQQMISAVQGVQFVIVDTLPIASAQTAGGKIYLVPAEHSEVENAKDEYITIYEGDVYDWEHIGSTTVDTTGYLKYTQQSLTTSQKAQARSNIGANATLVSGTNIKTVNNQSLLGSGNLDIEGAEDAVRYNIAQSLTDAQELQARTNISAASTADIANLSSAISAKYSKPAGGIPSTDMAAAVQTSLGKADSAYQKPASGIPASDLADGVIPTVPTDVVKYSSQSLSDTQKTQARANIGAAAASALAALETAIAAKYTKPSSGIPETDLAANVQSALALARTSIQSLTDYYDKTEIDSLLAAVSSEQYVDVATLPTASASTLGKIYLVGPTNGVYDRYYTSFDGTTYSWVGVGTTEINLANYATKAELNQLDQEVDDLRTDVGEKSSSVVRHTICTSNDFTNAGVGIIADETSANFGKSSSLSSASDTQYIDISDYAGKTIKITLPKVTNVSYSYGLVFFTGQTRDSAISPGVPYITGATENGYELVDLAVPATAVYVRITFRTTELEYFQCYYDETIEGDYTSGLGKRVKDLEDEVADLPGPVDGATENNIPVFNSAGWMKDDGVSVIDELLGNFFNTTTQKAIANNEAVVKGLEEKIGPLGLYKFGGLTASTYIYFPIKSGEKIKVKVTSTFGSGSSLYARVTNSSTNQELIIGLSATGEATFTAPRDLNYLYFYSPSLATGELTIIRDGSLASRVDSIDTRVTILEGQAGVGHPLYYSLSTAYDGYHNARNFKIYIRVKDNIFVRFRLGLYRPSLADTNVANTYWRLEESALFTLSGDTFTMVSESEVTTAGENEFVIRQTTPAKADFTGGYHGDEFIYDENGDLIDGAFAEFFADGVKIDTSADIALTGCNTFFYKERSQMVETANSDSDPTNVGRPIAWHEKRTEFIPGEGYKTENRLDMIENVPFYAFTGICCISRWISEYAMGESDPLTAMGTGDPAQSYQFSNYGNRLVYYKGNGYSARVTSEVIFGDDDAEQRCYVYNTSAYNKYYRTSQTLTNVSKFKSRMMVTFEKL